MILDNLGRGLNADFKQTMVAKMPARTKSTLRNATTSRMEQSEMKSVCV